MHRIDDTLIDPNKPWDLVNSVHGFLEHQRSDS